MSDRAALLCVLIGHEAPHPRDDQARCRRPGCDTHWPPRPARARTAAESPERLAAAQADRARRAAYTLDVHAPGLRPDGW